jgi:hypothetical protein
MYYSGCVTFWFDLNSFDAARLFELRIYELLAPKVITIGRNVIG